MGFPNKVLKIEKAILKHDTNEYKTYMEMLKDILQRDGLNDDEISIFCDKYRLLFLNHFVETSHFINYLFNRKYMKKDKMYF